MTLREMTLKEIFVKNKVDVLRLVSVIAFLFAFVACLPPDSFVPATTFDFFLSGVLAVGFFIASRAIDKSFGLAWWQVVCQAACIAWFCLMLFSRWNVTIGDSGRQPAVSTESLHNPAGTIRLDR